MEKRARRGGKGAAAAALALAGVVALAACSGAPTGSGGASAGGDAAASASAENDGAYRKITSDEAQRMMDDGAVVVVDVRTAREYAEGHVPGAINIPVESLGGARPSQLDDADAQLIVYCRTGVRSKQASDQLVSLGYAHVNDMGGIVDWHGKTVTGTEPGVA